MSQRFTNFVLQLGPAGLNPSVVRMLFSVSIVRSTNVISPTSLHQFTYVTSRNSLWQGRNPITCSNAENIHALPVCRFQSVRWSRCRMAARSLGCRMPPPRHNCNQRV